MALGEISELSPRKNGSYLTNLSQVNSYKRISLIIPYFHLPYFHVSNSALFLLWYSPLTYTRYVVLTLSIED